MFISLFGILILSNVVTALSSFFLAKDLDLLVAAPVDWLRLYGAKLLETTAHSSWMVVLVATPVLTAYGISYQGGFLYPLIAIAAVAIENAWRAPRVSARSSSSSRCCARRLHRGCQTSGWHKAS